MSDEQQAPERIWIDPCDQTFWNNTGDVQGLVEYAPVAQPPIAEREFLNASIAAWREIDRLSALPEGYKGLPPDTDPRIQQQAAWEAYREHLDNSASLPRPSPQSEEIDSSVAYPCVVDDKTLYACLQTVEQILRKPDDPTRLERFRRTKDKLLAQAKASHVLLTVAGPADGLVKQWVATLQDESRVTDEDAEDLTLRIIAFAGAAQQRGSELQREVDAKIVNDARGEGGTDLRELVSRIRAAKQQ